jgi:hypothetical protein
MVVDSLVVAFVVYYNLVASASLGCTSFTRIYVAFTGVQRRAAELSLPGSSEGRCLPEHEKSVSATALTAIQGD